ncbi:hypothetical protein V5799_023160 [Amblyomma americanum]|uniref:Uncharacterized protein n=1 Tax=Amblyomma americanum TaxID=6943 RepID=A0AAQ4FIC7_AMBAM
MLLIAQQKPLDYRYDGRDHHGMKLGQEDDGVIKSLHSSQGLYSGSKYVNKTVHKGDKNDSEMLGEKEYDEDIERWRQDYWRRRRYDRGEYDDNDREATTQEHKRRRQRQTRRKSKTVEDHGNVSGGGKRRRIQPYRRRGQYVTAPAPERDNRRAGRRGRNEDERRLDRDKFAGEYAKRLPHVRSNGRERIYSTRNIDSREEYYPSIRQGLSMTTILGSSDSYRKTYTSGMIHDNLPTTNRALEKESQQGHNNHWKERDVITEAFADEFPRKERISRRRRTDEDQEENRDAVLDTIRVRHETGSRKAPWNTEDASTEHDETLETSTEEDPGGKRERTREETSDDWYGDVGDEFNGLAPFGRLTKR